LRVPAGKAIRFSQDRVVAQVLVSQKLGWGGGRTLSFLFIFTFLVLSLTPLTISQSADVFENSPNLVQNPGFEDGLNYWDPFQYPSGWSSSSDNPHSGSYCAKFSFPAGSGGYDASIRSSGYQIYIEAGVPYYFSFWIREKDTHYTYDPNKTIVDAGIDPGCGAPTPSPSESWQLVDTTIIFSESGYAEVHFQLHGYATSDSAEFAVDDVVLKTSRPDSFSLISPTDVDSVKSPVTFAWDKSINPDPNDTVRYDLYLSRSIVFAPESTTVYDSLPDTTFTDSLDIKLWYWKVKAYDKWGAERLSNESWSFYVYLCGDYNGDEKITVTDIIYAVNYLFRAGAEPKPFIAGDVNCDDRVTVSDVVYLINYLFKLDEPCKNCP